MKFIKDLLIFDFEGGSGPKQVGAVLLDKETLEEKDSFKSYIYFDMQGKPSMKSGITQDMLDNAPKQAEVGKAIFDKFGTDVLIGAFVGDFDFKYFRMLIKEAGIDSKLYDYHFFDIWPVAYSHLVKNGYEGKINSDDIFREFGLKQRGNHDALEDARMASEVLRKVML